MVMKNSVPAFVLVKRIYEKLGTNLQDCTYKLQKFVTTEFQI